MKKVLCRVKWISAGKTVQPISAYLRFLYVFRLFWLNFLSHKLFSFSLEMGINLLRRKLSVFLERLEVRNSVLFILVLWGLVRRELMFSVFFTGIGGVVFPGFDFLETFQMLFIRSVIKPFLVFLHGVKC